MELGDGYFLLGSAISSCFCPYAGGGGGEASSERVRALDTPPWSLGLEDARTARPASRRLSLAVAESTGVSPLPRKGSADLTETHNHPLPAAVVPTWPYIHANHSWRSSAPANIEPGFAHACSPTHLEVITGRNMVLCGYFAREIQPRTRLLCNTPITQPCLGSPGSLTSGILV